MLSNASPDFRSGYIVIVGRPNVGKSTLFNALVGQRLSITTPKPQTTRNNILGILTTPGSQMLFLDTPGLLDSRYRLQEIMRNQIQDALRDADVLLGIVDASNFEDTLDREFQDTFAAAHAHRTIALNKIDLISADPVDRYLNTIRATVAADEVLPVSATTGDNLLQLRSVLEAALPPGPRYYPDDMLTEQPERFFVSELIREELFFQLRQEVPYAVAVQVEEFREDRPKTYIQAHIIVERNSQKGIVIGTGGKALKSVGRNARQKIEAFLERPVYLDLHVKVYENWRKKDTALRGLGYLA